MPLVLELELVNNLWEPIISTENPEWGAEGNIGLEAFRVKYAIPTHGAEETDPPVNTISNKWQIENPQIKCDICRMDNQLENEFAQLFLSGKAIPVNFSTYIVQQQALSGQNPSLNITRAISTLKSVFLTFTGKTPIDSAFDTLGYFEPAFLKPWNDFFHPMATSPNYTASRELEISLQIGGKRFPEYPLRTLSENFSSLKKCMGIHGSTFHSIDIDPYQYRTHKFIVGIDTEKVLQASFSGENLKSGSLLTVMMKNAGSVSSAYPTSAYVVMHADCIVNIRDTGVEMLD
jgi:hypothetical protein